MVSYIENPKEPAKKQLELTNEFSKVAGCKTNIQKSMHFYILMTNQKEK